MSERAAERAAAAKVPRVPILLVDDEPRNLDALEAILEGPEYELHRADNADRALRTLLECDVAAIILDIRMPGVSGFELAQVIKGTRRYRQIPILFLTAYLVDDADKVAGYGAGAVDYLTKPINPQILRLKISVFADLFRKTRALAELNERLEERVKERTAELERSEAALKLAARQKDHFVAVLAHELRNPLAPLRTGLDLVLSSAQLPAELSPTLAAMNRQLDHMVRLIDDLLDVARIGTGHFELRKESVDLATTIDLALDRTRSFYERRHQTVERDVQGSVSAIVDPVRVTQILGNLLDNASKFTPDGGRVRVELAAGEAGGPDAGVARIRVIDSGIGIAPERVEQVFEMFARRSSDADDRGLGIGLALSRNLAEMHGGTLTASSDGDGRGTTFTLRLPLSASTSVAPQLAMPELDIAPGGLRIVLVEDNDDIAETVGAWLEHAGHRVWIARTGPDGVERVRLEQPDVVLCDLGLPGMDGIAVCRAVRAMPLTRQPTMIAITGWGRDDDRHHTREAGFDHHLVKPFAPKVLRGLLGQLSSAHDSQ